MFGYIKPENNELKVKELALYNATYCGLCNTIKKTYSSFYTANLSYDFVFFALLKAAINKSKFKTIQKRCFVHPTKKKEIILTNNELLLSAKISVLMMHFKLRDNLLDKKGIKCIFYKLAYKLSKAKIKKYKLDNDVIKKLSDLFNDFNSLEVKETSIDTLSSKFGDILSYIFTIDTIDSNEQLILSNIGYNLGKFIYLSDAIDDIEKDYKYSSFNPLLFEGYNEESHTLSNEYKELLYNTAILSLEKASKAIELIDYSENKDIENIIKNTIYLGLPNIFKKILKKGEK